MLHTWNLQHPEAEAEGSIAKTARIKGRQEEALPTQRSLHHPQPRRKTVPDESCHDLRNPGDLKTSTQVRICTSTAALFKRPAQERKRSECPAADERTLCGSRSRASYRVNPGLGLASSTELHWPKNIFILTLKARRWLLACSLGRVYRGFSWELLHRKGERALAPGWM